MNPTKEDWEKRFRKAWNVFAEVEKDWWNPKVDPTYIYSVAKRFFLKGCKAHEKTYCRICLKGKGK